MNVVGCLAIAPGERLAVLVDEPLVDAGLRICDAAYERGASASMSVLPDSARPIATADAPFVASLSEVDAVLMWLSTTTTAEFGTHRHPIYQRAQALGVRIAFGAGIDEDILRFEMSADYEAMRVLCAAMAARLAERRRIRVTTPAGTEPATDRPWWLDDPQIRDRYRTD